MFFSFHLDTTGHNCKVRFSFKKICHRFKVDSECQPPNQTNLCKRTKTTFEDSKCPIYFCVRYFNFNSSLSIADRSNGRVAHCGLNGPRFKPS